MTVTDGRCGGGPVDFSAKRNPQNGILQRTIQPRTYTPHVTECCALIFSHSQLPVVSPSQILNAIIRADQVSNFAQNHFQTIITGS